MSMTSPVPGSLVTIDMVIEQCVQARNEGNTKLKLYRESWEALNLWLLGRMRKRKGADILNFASFNWEYFTTPQAAGGGGGKMRCRPIFIPAEAYVKSFKLHYCRPFTTPALAPTEAMNASRIAIKYSQSLTRDVFFLALRDILKKIGELIAAHADVRIAFSVGYLISKEKRVTFEFDRFVLANTPRDLGRSDGPSSSSSICSSSRDGSVPNSARSARSDGLSSRRSTPRSGRRSTPRDMEDGTASISSNDRPHTVASNHRFPLILLSQCRSQSTIKQAYQRYMIALQEEAEKDTQTRRLMKEHENQLVAKQRQRELDAIRRTKDVQQMIISQMEDRQRKRQSELSERKKQVETTIPIANHIPEPYLAKDQLVRDLIFQIKCKAENKKNNRDKCLHEEKEHLKCVRAELERMNAQKRQQKEDTVNMLRAAWDLDTQFIKCKRMLTEKGGDTVIDYLDQMGIKEVILPPPLTEKEKLMKSLGLGVGYDARGK